MSKPNGKWKLVRVDISDPEDTNVYECSECGDLFQLEFGTPKENNYNFCPNCGAEMTNAANNLESAYSNYIRNMSSMEVGDGNSH